MTAIRHRQPETKTPNVRRAYSLVEVMIGMAILSVVLLACIVALPGMRSVSYRSDAVRMGFSQLNAEIESYRTQTFEQLQEDVDGATNSSENWETLTSLLSQSFDQSGKLSRDTRNVTQNGVDYTVYAFMHYIDSAERMIETVVVVQWEYAKEPQVISSRAIFSKDGLSDKKFSTPN